MSIFRNCYILQTSSLGECRQVRAYSYPLCLQTAQCVTVSSESWQHGLRVAGPDHRLPSDASSWPVLVSWSGRRNPRVAGVANSGERSPALATCASGAETLIGNLAQKVSVQFGARIKQKRERRIFALMKIWRRTARASWVDNPPILYNTTLYWAWQFMMMIRRFLRRRLEAGSEVNVEVICQEVRKNLELKWDSFRGWGWNIDSYWSISSRWWWRYMVMELFTAGGKMVKSVSKVKCSTI